MKHNEYMETKTGEIITLDASGKKAVKSVTPTTKYVGIETKHISDCKTKDQIMDTITQLDDKYKYSTKVNYPLLIKYSSTLTPKVFSLLTHLCESVFCWNFYDGCTKHMQLLLENKKLSRDLTVLEDLKLIKIINRGNVTKTDILIEVAPSLTFKGGYDFRSSRIVKWYKISTTTDSLNAPSDGE